MEVHLYFDTYYMFQVRMTQGLSVASTVNQRLLGIAGAYVFSSMTIAVYRRVFCCMITSDFCFCGPCLCLNISKLKEIVCC